MFDAFGPVKQLIKLESVKIDNNVFRLHYKATLVILVLCTMLVTFKQYIGDPIDCIVEGIPRPVMETYCWIHSTFSVTEHLSGEQGFDHAHPGVGPDDPEDRRQHKYYQWVVFTLTFQAFLFYIPRYLWKLWEGGKVRMLVQDMNVPIVDEDVQTDRITVLLDYFKANRNKHRFYALKFVLCEILNFANVVGQIYFMDMFLGGEFTTYGRDVLAMTELPMEERIDPMAGVFPKVTKCTFKKFGPSGTIEQFDGLCILPVNIINEKIYVFLWLWFIIVSTITGVQLIVRMLTALSGFRAILMKFNAKSANQYEVDDICREFSFGDWFILYQVGKNMDTLMFKDFVHSLHESVLGSDEEEVTPFHKENGSEDKDVEFH